jgi:speckle-type POZ protein
VKPLYLIWAVSSAIPCGILNIMGNLYSNAKLLLYICVYDQVSRSPVFKAMLENEMEESRSGTIKIGDVSYDALRAFVNYLYNAEACLDEQMACDLLVLAEKYQVKHLKSYCEKFLVSKLTWENSIINYAFAHQHNAKTVLDAALSTITDNMDKLTKREEYVELVEKDPRLVVEIYEAYLSKQVNTAAHKDSPVKP